MARSRFGLALVLLLTGSAVAANGGPISYDGGHDLGRLIEQAGKRFDLESQDAVVLLDEQRVAWTSDGRLLRTVHQVVYVRTSMGIHDYADLRVPFDAERQSLSVAALRTWRLSDRRWIDSGESARVETLPFALDHAPDHAGRRETMLLHDGVELPCLLETLYTLADAAPFRAGASGVWTLSRPDPAMLSRFVLSFPTDSPIAFHHGPGVAEPARGVDSGSGLRSVTFEAGPLDALPRPETIDRAWRVPHIAWTTWSDWESLGQDLDRSFEEALVLDDRLKKRLAKVLHPARSEAEKAALVAGFVAETTRSVDYATGWWPAPRPALRTWESSYGTAADRAALAAALFREAGLSARLGFRGAGYGGIGADLPTLSWCGDAGLWISGEMVEGWFDGASATLANGVAPVVGRLVWRPGVDQRPTLLPRRSAGTNLFAVRFDLRLDEKREAWEGSGFLMASGALCPYDRMTGLGDEALAYVRRLATAVLDGATVGDLSPGIFEPGRVALGFGVRIPLAEPDVLGRLRFEARAPEPLAHLLQQSAAQLHEEHRESEVTLPGPLTQRVEVRIATGDLEAVYMPPGLTLANGAGRLVVSAKAGEGELSFTRELVLASPAYAAADWADLRALLLAEERPGNRLLLLREPVEPERGDK